MIREKDASKSSRYTKKTIRARFFAPVLITALAVAVIEGLVMFAFTRFPGLSTFQTIVIDSCVLALSLIPIFYFIWLRPWSAEIKRLSYDEARLETAEKHQQLINSLDEGVFMADASGVITYANEALARIHGFDSPGQLIGKRFITFIVSEKVIEVLESFKRQMETGISAGIVSTEIVRQDGVRRHIDVHPTVIVEKAKRPEPVASSATLQIMSIT